MAEPVFSDDAAREPPVNSWCVRNTFLCFSSVQGPSQRARATSADSALEKHVSEAWCRMLPEPPPGPKLAPGVPKRPVFIVQAGQAALARSCLGAVTKREPPLARARRLESDSAADAGPQHFRCMRRASPPSKDGSGCTTLMLRNIACSYTQDDIASILDDNGLEGKYNFIYLPQPSRSIKRKQTNLGYVFVNFKHLEFVEECMSKFDGHMFGDKGVKGCQIAPARIQGDANCKRDVNKRSHKQRFPPTVKDVHLRRPP